MLPGVTSSTTGMSKLAPGQETAKPWAIGTKATASHVTGTPTGRIVIGDTDGIGIRGIQPFKVPPIGRFNAGRHAASEARPFESFLGASSTELKAAYAWRLSRVANLVGLLLAGFSPAKTFRAKRSR